jgi:hypothetical protein
LVFTIPASRLYTDGMVLDQAISQLDGLQEAATQGVGQRVLRKEDDRYLAGEGEYIADISLPLMKELAFVRSPVAHARIRGVTKPAGFEDRVFTRWIYRR